MKIASNIVGGLLGLLFLAGGLAYFFVNMPMPYAKGSPPDLLMAVWGPAHFMTFVKVFEVLGGLLTAIPRTRNFGLLVLGPIIINIVAFQALIAREGVFNPVLIGICLAALFLLWCGRRKFAALMN